MGVLGGARASCFLAIIVVFMVSLRITKCPLKNSSVWGRGGGNRTKGHNNCYDDCHGKYHAIFETADEVMTI